MQLNLEGASVFPNIPSPAPFHKSYPLSLPLSHPLSHAQELSVTSLYSLCYSFTPHPASFCLFHSVFESILLPLSFSLSLISKYVLEIRWIMQRCSCSSSPVSFHPSLFCSLIFHPPREKGEERREEERRRVIGFPLIARVMLTVHKSCHWNSASFIFWFCLIVFRRLLPTLIFLPLPSSLPHPSSPLTISPRVSSGRLDCLDGPRMGQCVSA